ncbi:MAG: hypothetical protein ACI8U4_001770, partial [Natronomonas sp.]
FAEKSAERSFRMTKDARGVFRTTPRERSERGTKG